VIIINKLRDNSVKYYIISVISVIIATACAWLLFKQNILDKAHTGLLYLLIVASMANLYGTRPGLLASAFSFLLWNFFFFTPIYTFAINDLNEWFLLFSFFVIAIMVGQITGRLKTREMEALAREKDTMALYKSIISINSQTDYEKILKKLVEEILLSTGAQGCAIIAFKNGTNEIEILSGAGNIKNLKENNTINTVKYAMKECKAVGLGPPPEFSTREDILWPVSIDKVDSYSENHFDVYIPMNTGERTIGLMYAIPEEGKEFNRGDCRLLVAFASNATTFMEKQRLLEKEGHAKAMRESERLKSVIFSSISHNLKTPIASLTATLSSLSQEDVRWEQDSLKEQFSLMNEDIERLTENIEKLLGLAKLESGNWKPQKELNELREIISNAVSRLPEEQYKRLVININDDLPLIWVDSIQISQVIRHLVENALVYSYENSTVTIEADYNKNSIIFRVDDEGPGIPETEKVYIFRKFFRGHIAEEKSIRGTGLGLSICQEIIHAHKGTIKADKSPKGGARFLITIPLEEKGEVKNE